MKKKRLTKICECCLSKVPIACIECPECNAILNLEKKLKNDKRTN